MLAQALGAKPPLHVPEWVVRVLAGEDAVMGATQSRGASNAKAKTELGWTLRYPTWRVGFAAGRSPENREPCFYHAAARLKGTVTLKVSVNHRGAEYLGHPQWVLR